MVPAYLSLLQMTASLYITGIGKTLQLSHPMKLEDMSNTTTSCCGGSNNLPPIFPPTPTSASSDHHDFPYYFERQITQEFQDPGMFLPTCSGLHSPGYAVAMVDSVYESFFKQENMYQQSSCVAQSMHLDGLHSVGQFEGTPPPLTPQSSIYSSNSPLSHASIHSPESAAVTPDLDMARPLSQGSMHNVSSPQIGDVAHTPMLAYSSTSSSNCTSPLQHNSAPTSLDIAASLDLVDGANSNPATGFMHDYNMISPIYPGTNTGNMDVAFPMNHAYLPVANPIGASYSPATNSDYSQYDFELHQLMSDPSELLNESLSKEMQEDVKPTITQPLQAQTPPAVMQ